MKWQTAVALGAVLVAGATGAYASYEHRQAALAQTAAEAARLDAANVTRAHAATQRELQKALDDLSASKDQVAGFAEALARAQKAAKARLVAVERSSTGPVAGVAGRLENGQTIPPRIVRGQIDVVSAELRTEAGNRVLVQAAEASQIDPDGSKHLLFGGELRADLTRYLSSEVGPPKAGPGWGVGALGLCTTSGCSVGALVSPPLFLWGHGEVAGGLFGGRGGFGFQLQVMGRF